EVAGFNLIQSVNAVILVQFDTPLSAGVVNVDAVAAFQFDRVVGGLDHRQVLDGDVADALDIDTVTAAGSAEIQHGPFTAITPQRDVADAAGVDQAEGIVDLEFTVGKHDHVTGFDRDQCLFRAGGQVVCVEENGVGGKGRAGAAATAAAAVTAAGAQ